MSTAVREPTGRRVRSRSGIRADRGAAEAAQAAPDHRWSEICGCVPVPAARAARPRCYTVRRAGRDAFEGSFEDAYAWAVTAGEGPVTLVSRSAERPAA